MRNSSYSIFENKNIFFVNLNFPATLIEKLVIFELYNNIAYLNA